MSDRDNLKRSVEAIILADTVAKLRDLGLTPDEICLSFTRMGVCVKHEENKTMVNNMIKSMIEAVHE